MISVLCSFLDWAQQPQAIGYFAGIFAMILIQHIVFYIFYYVQSIFVYWRTLPYFLEISSSQGIEERVNNSSYNEPRQNADSNKYSMLNRSQRSRKKKKKFSVPFKNPNVAFYQNKIPAKPNEEYIEDILQFWMGNYVLLEETTTYIQWLFPNRTPGTNKYAHVLTDEEALIIQKTPTLKSKVKLAFEMMLDLYGMRLDQDNQVIFSDKYQSRLQELNRKDNHQFLNITRILLALKELGHTDLMLNWMDFLAHIIYEKKYLNYAKFSFETFWLSTLDAEDKKNFLPKIST